MAKFLYVKQRKMSKDTQELLGKIIAVIDEYEKQHYQITLRQLFYQLVSRGIVRNEQRNYEKIGRLLTRARLCGKVDWKAIVDRVRVPNMASEWPDIRSLVDSAIKSYRKKRHAGQQNYVEVWVEKDALSGILEPITRKYHVNLMVTRGYSSISAMYEAAGRFTWTGGRDLHILYLGDHDPSGLDMVRNIKARFDTFQVHPTVTPIALTMEQIREYRLPHNPVKVNDSRAPDYVRRHGEKSWELDALPPWVLTKLLRTELENLIDMDAYNQIVAEEEAEKDRLRRLAKDV